MSPFSAIVRSILKQAGRQSNKRGRRPPFKRPGCRLSKGCDERGGADLTCRSGGIPAERSDYSLTPAFRLSVAPTEKLRLHLDSGTLLFLHMK